MDVGGMVLLSGLGGGLVVYGVIKRNKTRSQNPNSDNAFLREIHEVDPAARTEGNLALVIGVVFLVGALFG